MKTIIITLLLVSSCSPALAKDNNFRYEQPKNTNTTNSGGASTYPNYVAPKSDFKKCTPVVITEVNVFTKQPYQVVKCY